MPGTNPKARPTIYDFRESDWAVVDMAPVKSAALTPDKNVKASDLYSIAVSKKLMINKAWEDVAKQRADRSGKVQWEMILKK